MPKSNKILHIGGPLDGKRRVWPVVPNVMQIATMTSTQQNVFPLVADDSISVATYTYSLRRQRLADGTDVEIAVYSEVKDILAQLIKGYRYHRNPRPKRSWLPSWAHLP